MFLHTYGTDEGIYQVKTIACDRKVNLNLKRNLNVFKGAVIIVIIYQEIVAGFLPFIITVQNSLIKFLRILLQLKTEYGEV